MEPQKDSDNQSYPRAKATKLRNHILRLQIYYESIVTKTAWYWHKNRHMYINGTEWRTEKQPHIISEPIFTKGARIQDRGKRTKSSQMVLTGYPRVRQTGHLIPRHSAKSIKMD